MQVRCRGSPSSDPEPVIHRFRFAEERLDGRHEPSFPVALYQRATLLHGIPSTSQVSRRWPRGPEGLKQRHGDAPPGHPARWIQFGDVFEGGPCLRVRHVVQQGDAAIELGPDPGRAIDPHVDRSQGMRLVLSDSGRREATSQENRQGQHRTACSKLHGHTSRRRAGEVWRFQLATSSPHLARPPQRRYYLARNRIIPDRGRNRPKSPTSPSPEAQWSGTCVT